MSDSVKPQQPLPLLVPAREAARLLNLSRTAVYAMMARGELPYVKYGRARRVSMEALRAWIAEHTVKASEASDGQAAGPR